MNKLEKGEKIANEKLEEVLKDECMNTNEKVCYMNGLLYGLGKAGMLHLYDCVEVYSKLQKELGVRILP